MAADRQGLTYGSAYLREASSFLRTTLLPAAQQVYDTQAADLAEDQARADGGVWTVLAVVALAAALVALGLLHRRIRRTTRRRLTPGVALAGAALALLGVWGVIALGTCALLTGTAREEGCLNPFFACSRGLNGFLPHLIMSTVLPGAFREGPGGTFLPALVEDVKVKKTRPFTLTYRIRREARWSDGQPVTAADFVFTYDTSRSPGVEPHPATAADLAHVADVRALGERTVRVVLRSRFAFWR